MDARPRRIPRLQLLDGARRHARRATTTIVAIAMAAAWAPSGRAAHPRAAAGAARQERHEVGEVRGADGLAKIRAYGAPGNETAHDRGAQHGHAPARLSEGPLVLHYWPGGERLALRLAERARALPPPPALPDDVLVEDGEPVHIYLAPDPARFDSLAGGSVPEWGAGLAFPDAGVIVLPGYLSERAGPHELGRILRHELAHVALHRYLAPARIPRWFDEGYARWAAGEWDWEAMWQLRLAFALNRAPPLDSLALDWPDDALNARVAYLLAASTVSFLTERGGERALALFLQRWKEGGTLEPALRRTYGLTIGQFEEDWSAEVRRRYGWALLASHSLVFWLGASVLLLLVYIRRRCRDLQRLERLRASEPPDSPAYWLGEDPDDPPADGSPPDRTPPGTSPPESPPFGSPTPGS
jgi:hypothetical protein